MSSRASADGAFLVIGVGNRSRSDDGVGPVVADCLRDSKQADLCVLEACGEGAALLESWQPGDSVIIVDAAASGSAPGSIHRFDAGSAPLPARFFHSSSHHFGVAEAVELARVLKRLPRRLLVYAIEGQSFSAGIGLSAAVAHSAKQVVEEIRAVLAAWG